MLTCPSKNKRININEGKDKNVVIFFLKKERGMRGSRVDQISQLVHTIGKREGKQCEERGFTRKITRSG